MKEKQENKKKNTRGKNWPGVNVQSTFSKIQIKDASINTNTNTKMYV